MEDLLGSEERLHVGHQEQDPRVMQSRQLVSRHEAQSSAPNTHNIASIAVMQSRQLVMKLRVQHLTPNITSIVVMTS